MSKSVVGPAYRAKMRTATRFGVLVIAAAATAGCSTSVTRFNFPFFGNSSDSTTTGSVNPADSLTPIPSKTVFGYRPGESLLASGRTTPVERSELASAVPAPKPMEAPRWSSPSRAQAGDITVSRGDSLYNLARRHGVTVSALKSANNLDGDHIRPGQRLTLPGRGSDVASRSAPLPRPAALTQLSSASDRTHKVANGESVYSISRRYGVGYKTLAEYNGMSSPDRIKPGQVLKIPSKGDNGRAIAQSTKPAPKPTRVARLSRPGVRSDATTDARVVRTTKIEVPKVTPQQVKERMRTANAAKPAPKPAAKPAARPVNSGPLPKPEGMSSSRFRWPVHGRIISRFGAKPNGVHNDGINLSVPQGTSVKASENGVVAYAGNELKGYGNLILVRHANGWVTAYAHTSKILVKRGDKVRRGQIIAKAGQTGNVSKPQLHFELRKGSRPVNPLKHMAAI